MPRGERFNGHQDPQQHHHHNHSDHQSHHDQQFNNSNYQDQHLNNPNHHSNYHHPDQHFNNSNYHPHPHQHPHNYNHNNHVNVEPNDSFGTGGFPSNSGGGGGGGGGGGYGSGYSVRKRGWHRGASPDHVDGVVRVKLYVVPVSRTATEADIRPVFEEHGNVVEVVILKDKRTGQQQGSCFVKYATVDDAERAIRSLNNQYTFPGEHAPLIVKYADGERERLGNCPRIVVVDKLYVGGLNRDASKNEIEEDA